MNNLPELWALLNFILPKIFNSVRSFDEWFNSPFSKESGQERIDLNEEEQLLIIRRLHKVLRPFLLRRLKKDVEKELPDKVETVIKCPMSALQYRLYEQVRNRKATFSSEGTFKKKILSNLVMQFRKICNHPYVFDEVEDAVNPSRVTDRDLFRVAGKFELLDRILPKFKATGHRVLMFFQMTQIMNIMEDYLRWKNLTFLRLDGNTKAEDRTTMLKSFNSSDDPPFMFLLSTRAGGLGLNLQTADTVIIFDSDWNPHQDLQAQDRAHRIGQTKEVRILRLITSKSIEESILARAQYKLDIDGKVIQAGKFDNKTSDREREELLRALLGNEEEEDEESKEEKVDGDLDDEELNEIISRDEGELALFNKMDKERKAQELLEWRNSGHKGDPPPRLMQDNELPDIYLEDPLANEIPEKPIELGRGNRQKKQVVYDDGLNENQFLEAIEEGDVEGFIQKKRENASKRERKKSLKLQREDEEDEDDDEDQSHQEDQEEEEEKGSERDSSPDIRTKTNIRKSKSDLGLDKDLILPQDGPVKKRGRKSKKTLFADVDPDAVDTIDPPLRAALTRVFEACYHAVVDLQVTDDDEEEEE